MDERDFVTAGMCAEHMKRIDDENNRQNHRLEKLENAMDNLTDLTVNVGKLATSMDNMSKELTKQGERLEKIEDRPVKRWDSIVAALIAGAVGLLFGLISSGIIH